MRYKIKDVAKINERAINKKYNGTINYIDTSSVTDNIFNNPKVYSSIKEAPSRARRVANLGDTIISTVRPNMKHTGFIDKVKYKNCIYSTGFAVVTPLKDRVDPFYLYLVLTNNKNTELLQNIGETSTSTYPSVKPSDIENLEHDFPSINEQKEISTTIKMFENKIYLNNKINTNLLEFVTLIWKKYNSNTVNGVTLKKLANTIVTGKTPSTKIKENYGNDIPFVKIPDMHNKVFIDETSQSLTLQGANSQKNKYIPANSILVSCIGTPGLVSITDKNIQTNQQINSLILDEKYLYCTFIELRSNKDMIGNLGSGGTTIKNLNKTDFSNIVINIPNTDKLLEKFNSVARPIFNNIHENMIQTQKLKKIKATLLSEYF